MFEVFRYINIPPIRILGMLVFVAAMIGFILWVSGFRKNAQPIMKNKKYFLAFSGIVLLICIGSLLFKGLNYGLDFTGGTIIQLAVRPEVTIPEIRSAIEEFAEKTENPQLFDNPKVQLTVEVESRIDSAPGDAVIPAPEATPAPPVMEETPVVEEPAPTPVMDPDGEPENETGLVEDGDTDTHVDTDVHADTPADHEAVATPVQVESETTPPPAKAVRLETFRKAIIQIQKIEAAQLDDLVVFLNDKLNGTEVLKSETVGPTIGQELKSRALMALLIALLAQLIFITFRFGTKLRFGIAADIALIHDLIIMVGFYSLLGRPVDSPFLAALLTIIGYSVMDSVVVFDRVRENLKLMKGSSYEEAVNLSLNQVITRTAATSFTTILTLFAIYYFGGDTLNNFALALLIGAVAGTYSSLFVASPLLVWFDEMVKAKERKRVEDRRARLEEEARIKASKKGRDTDKSGDSKEDDRDGDDEDDEDSGEDQAGESKKKQKKTSRKRRR